MACVVQYKYESKKGGLRMITQKQVNDIVRELCRGIRTLFPQDEAEAILYGSLCPRRRGARVGYRCADPGRCLSTNCNQIVPLARVKSKILACAQYSMF